MSFNLINDRWKFFYRTIFRRWRTDVHYLTDPGKWSFYWDAYYITRGLRNRFGLRFYHHCFGVDIHQFKEKVEELIRNHGATNFTLFQTEGCKIPLENRAAKAIFIILLMIEFKQ